MPRDTRLSCEDAVVASYDASQARLLQLMEVIMTERDAASEAALQRGYQFAPPVDPVEAANLLKEAKQIVEGLGVTFFLRQGTCLGAIRDNAIIPWDDDVDIGGVIGLHGLTEESVYRVADAFRAKGYYAKVESRAYQIYVPLMKSPEASIRVDWTCYRIIDDGIWHFPGIRLPLRLFTELKEIEFLGENFLVPNPPEEYLSLKYGKEWSVPKQYGYEKDVLDMIPDGPAPGRAGRLKQSLFRRFLPWRSGSLRILEDGDTPVAGAEVVVAGLGCSRTDKQGYARFYLPCEDFYALIIRYDGHEEVLYQEQLAPGGRYVYRRDTKERTGRYCVLVSE